MIDTLAWMAGGVMGGVAVHEGLKKARHLWFKYTHKDACWPDWCLHWLVLGAWGAGKSTSILWLVLCALQRGYGVILLDPHGQLARQVLMRIPPHRIKDVIYHNPAKGPLGLSPLYQEKGGEGEAHMIASHLIHLLQEVTPGSWGALQDTALREAIMETVRLRGDYDDLVEIMSKSKDQNERNMAARLRRLSLLGTLKAMLNSPPVPINKVMANSGIYILDLGDYSSTPDVLQVLYQLHMARIMQVATTRRPDAWNPPVFVVADELQRISMSGKMIGNMLAELRKYNISMCIGHQSTAQVDSALGHLYELVGNQFTFRCNRSEARLAEIKTGIPAKAIENQPQHQYLQRVMHYGSQREPKFVRTELPPPETLTKEQAAWIVKRSIDNYGVVKHATHTKRRADPDLLGTTQSGPNQPTQREVLPELQDSLEGIAPTVSGAVSKQVPGAKKREQPGVRVLSISAEGATHGSTAAGHRSNSPA